MKTKQVGFTIEKETSDLIERFSGFTRTSKSTLFRDWVYDGLRLSLQAYLDDPNSPPSGDFLDLLQEIEALLDHRDHEYQWEQETPEEERRFL